MGEQAVPAAPAVDPFAHLDPLIVRDAGNDPFAQYDHLIKEPPEPSFWDSLNDKVNFVGTQLTKGGIELAAAPNTIGRELAHTKGPLQPEGIASPVAPEEAEAWRGAAKFAERFWPSRETMHNKVFKDLGVPERDPDPDSPVEGAVAAGLRAAPAGVLGGPAMGALAFTGGVGGDLAAHLFPDHPALAEFAGNVLGAVGVGGAAKAVQLGVNTARAVGRPLLSGGQKAIVGGAIAKAAGTTPDELLGRLDASPGELVPGSRPTLGQQTGDPNLLNIERATAQKVPEANTALSQQQADQNTARRRALDNVAPHDQDAADVAKFVQGRLESYQQNSETFLQRAKDAARQRIEQLGPNASAQDTGRIIQEEYDSALKDMKQRVTNKYESIDPDGTLRLNVSDVYAKAGQAIEKYLGPGSGGPPADLTEVLKDLRADNLPYKTLQNIDSRLGKILGEARGKDDRVVGAAAAIRGAIRSRIDESAQETAGIARTMGVTENVAINGEFTPQQAAAYQEAKALRAEQGSKFQDGASGQLRAGNRTPAEIPSVYFNSSKGGADDAAKFVEALGDRPRAVQSLRDYAVNDLRAFASKPDGTIDPRRFAQWMQRHDGALSQFPELRDQMRNAGQAQELVERISGALKQGSDEYEKSAARFFLKNDPDRAVAALLKSPTAQADMRQLVSMASADKTGDAILGLRRAVIDNVKSSSLLTATDVQGNRILSNDAFTKWMDKNRATLRPLFSDEHMNMLERIQQDLSRSAQTGRSVYGGGSPTYGNFSVGQILDSMLGRAQSVLPTKALDASLGRALRWLYKTPDADMQEMFTRALSDPQYARTLLVRVTPSNQIAVSRRLQQLMTRPTGGAAAAFSTSPAASGQ